VKGLILLGGLGTRLRPLTLARPKPLLPILNRPMFAYQLDQLKRHGIREVILALGYQAAHFRRHLGDGRRWGMRFVYSQEKTPLGTGGAIRHAAGRLTGTTVVLNGDILSEFPLGEMLRWHHRKRAEATLTLSAVADPSRFGLIETDRDGKVRRFIEKPSPEEATVNTINAGCYLLEPSFLRQMPDRMPLSIERDVFPRLLKNGARLYGYLNRGYWADIGTLRSFWQTHMDLMTPETLRRRADLRTVRPGLWAGKGVRLSPSLRVEGRVVLGDGCRVRANVEFRGRVCVGPGCDVGENVVLSDCVVLEGTRLEENCRLENCLVGERCRVGAHSHIGADTVISGGSLIGPYTQRVPDLFHENPA
jgi:mannose-1-phosphate guanylyltransferase